PELDVVAVANARQRELLERLLGADAAARPMEVLRVDLEDLKTALRSRLLPEAKASPTSVSGSAASEPIVYISHRSQDPRLLGEILQYFRSQHCDVSLLDHEGQPAEVRRRHRKWIRLSDGMVILYTAGTKCWAEETALEARDFARRQGRPR